MTNVIELKQRNPAIARDYRIVGDHMKRRDLKSLVVLLDQKKVFSFEEMAKLAAAKRLLNAGACQ